MLAFDASFSEEQFYFLSEKFKICCKTSPPIESKTYFFPPSVPPI